MSFMKHIKTSCKLISVILCAAMLASLCACGSSRADASASAQGTDASITAYGKNAQKAVSDAAGVFSAFNSMLDAGSRTSAMYALNNAGGASVVVPGQIADMLGAARTVYDRSNGALDPTIQPVAALWGFDTGKYAKPTDEQIDAALKKLCFDQLKIQYFSDSGTYTVTMPSGTQLTFGSMSRGCACDYAVQAMRDDGVKSGIISMSGCAHTLGVKPDGTQWNVSVADPNDASGSIGYLTVGETAVSTCGGYTQSFSYSDGVTYNHILNPATGYPAKTDLRSVTIVCASGVDADCLSWALCALGSKKAIKYWRNYGGFDMILVTTDNRVLCTSGLTESFSLQNDSYTLSYTE